VNSTNLKIRAAITAVGHYLPDKILDNKYFESIVDTSDEWIKTRTGIVERRMMESGAASDMGAKAAMDILKKRGISPDEIDVIIVPTVTPDYVFPSTACMIQKKIGANNCWGFDISAACSGFLFALMTGVQFIESGAYKKVLVIGSEKMTCITDYTDRNTCVLFGDAAAGVLLEPSTDPELGIIDHYLRIDGSGEPFLNMKGGGSKNPTSMETLNNKWHYVYQEGKAVFKVAVVGMADVAEAIMKKNNLKSEDVAYLVPHQANLRIIDACAARMGVDRSKVMINIHKYGNTTSATIPLCLSDYFNEGKLKKGDNLILAAFGAGWTWGAVYLKWAI
jgi:3-oxoacyl-[acyl-carrier-protein] synthase III